MTERSFIVEFDVTKPDNTTETLRFSTAVLRPFPPTDPDRPNAISEPTCLDPANLQREIYLDMRAQTGGVGAGSCVIANADGSLNYLRSCRFGQVRIWWGEVDKPFSDYMPVLIGRIETPRQELSTEGGATLTFSIYDERRALDTALQTLTYAGNNTGFEGSDNLSGTVKPYAIGSVQNVPAVLVSLTPQPTYQVHSGAITSITSLYDRGAQSALTHGGNFTGSAFNSATAATNKFITDYSRGLVRVGVAFGGVLTADVVTDADPAPVQIKRLLERAGVPTAKIGAAFDAPPAGTSGSVGVWITDDTSTWQTIEALARSVGCWCLPDAHGVWQLGALSAPAAVPLVTFTDADEISLTTELVGMAEPIWKLTVEYARNYQVIDANLFPAGGGEARREWVGKQYRAVERKNESIKSDYFNAGEVKITTLLNNKADADALADKLFALFSVPRDQYSFVTELTPETINIGLGDTVRLEIPRYGIAKNFVVRAIKPTVPEMNTITFGLWG